ncbi:unnamed protein product [Camellia sinensis]
MAMAVAAKRGSIAFSATYRPPVPLNIFSCSYRPRSKEDKHVITDGENYNYNGQEISSAALKTILKREKLASEGKVTDVNSGHLTGMVFVSERQGGLELLHIALRYNDNPSPKPKVFCLADAFGKDNFSGVRMEDSGCIAGDNLVYVTTKDPVPKLRQPWTAVYKTNLKTGKIDRLTPSVSGNDIQRNFHKLESPHPDVGLFRVLGIFPTFSKDGSKVAFVDNEFKAVWVAENAENKSWHIVYKHGTKLVFRSTRGGNEKYKNLYIMDIGETGCQQGGEITRLTNGPWTDTHCQWSPRGDWIVFSSTCKKPKSAPEKDHDLDPGYFAAFLVKVSDSKVLIKVMESSSDCKGHVNHPFFSPDGKSIVVTADLAAVSVDPIPLPHFLHSMRPYGDIFTFDIAMYNFTSVRKFNRITHSRYENSTATWTMFSTQDPHAAWNMRLNKAFTPSCPYARHDGGES